MLSLWGILVSYKQLQFKSFTAYNNIVHYWNMKEHVFLSKNQDSIVEDFWIIHLLNTTNALTNNVYCSGFWHNKLKQKG